MEPRYDNIELPEAWRNSQVMRRNSQMTLSLVMSGLWGLYIWDDKLMITGMKMSRMKMREWTLSRSPNHTWPVTRCVATDHTH